MANDNPLLDPSLWAAPNSDSATPSARANTASAPAASSNPLLNADAWKTPTPPPSPTPDYSGSVVPMSRYSDGSVGFDSNAGLVGLAKRAASGLWSGATLPGDVATGKVDPSSSDAIRRSLDMATLAAPDAAVATARKVITPPTADVLKATGGAGYDAVRNMGVDYSVPHVADRAAQVQQGLNDKGITARVAPDLHATLNDLQNVPDGAVSVPISLLDNARREFGQIAGNFNNKPQQMGAKTAQNAIDDFIANPPTGSVLSGPADQAAKALTEARANYAAGSRSDAINQRGEYAEFKANDSNSGQNLSNNLRKQASWFLDPTHPNRRAGFSADEISALEDVNRGTPTRNAARIAGNLLGGGLGMHGLNTAVMGAVGGHEAAGFPGAIIGAATPLLGVAAKKIDQSLTQKAFNKADELVRQRSTLYREQASAAPTNLTASPSSGIAARSAIASAIPPEIAPPIPAKPMSTPISRAKKGAKAPFMTPAEAAQYVQQLKPGDAFARGGSVKPKLSHDQLVSRLLDASEKAKAATKRETKAILDVPDNTVAKALEVAQRAI